MVLMNKESIYDGPMKVRDVDRWPLDCKAVKFLLMTESAYSIHELKKVKKSPAFLESSNVSKASTIQL
jgi:hypothetical protein